MGKKQLGWRKDNADQELYLPMCRLGYHLKVHLAPYGKIQETWISFKEQLLAQESFKNSDGSLQSFKDQWNKRIAAFKYKFGWDDGKTSNLSDLAGDKSELENIIASIISEGDEEKERKEQVATEKEKTNACEQTVLSNALNEKTPKKRKKCTKQTMSQFHHLKHLTLAVENVMKHHSLICSTLLAR